MAFATTIASGLSSGPSTGIPLSGAQQITVSGTFKTTAGNNVLVLMELSSDGGTTYVPVPGSQTPYPTAFVMDLAAGAYIRANVNGGGVGASITVMAGALP